MAFEDDYDPRLMREFMSQMQESGKVTEELAKEIEQSNTSFAKLRREGLKNFSDGLSQFAGSSKALASSLAEGQRGFSVLDTAVDLTAGALKGLLGIIPGVSTGIDAVAGASKLLINQMEKQVAGFQTLGETGALTEEGIEGFQRSMLQSGLTLEDYTKRIASSSRTLARFQGLTGTGAETFAEITRKLTQDTDVSLRRLGLSAEQMGESTEAFLTRQTRLGMSQGMTATQLAASTTSYIKELDVLSKVTGQSRKAIQDQQDAALSETRFRASMEGLRGTVDQGAINSIMNFQSSISDMDSTLGAGVRDLASGFTATEAARRAEFVTGGRASKIMAQLQSGQINELQAREQMQQALRDNREQLVFAGRALGDNASIIGNTAGLFDIINAEMGTNGEFIKKATDAQKGQIGGANALTNNLVNVQQDLEKAQIEVQRLFFKAMPMAAKATEMFTDKLSSALVKANNFLADKFGGERMEEPGQDQAVLTKATARAIAADILAKQPSPSKRSAEENAKLKEAMDIIKGIKKASTEIGTTQKVAAIQTRQQAQKNLLDAGVTPHNDIVKIAQLEGVGSARKVANANKDDLVSNVLGTDAVGKYGAITIGELKDVVAEMPNIMGPNIENGITNTVSKAMLAGQRDLASGFIATEAARRLELNKLNDNVMTGPKEKYTSTVANLDVEPQQAVDKEATEKLARTTDTYSELLKENNGKLDQVISHIAASNNIQNKILTSSYS